MRLPWAAGIAKRGGNTMQSRNAGQLPAFARLRYIFARLSADGDAVVGELQFGAVGELDFVAVAFLLQLDNLRA